ncbi:16750_t:CDS:2, partial [Racocetra persica]
KESETSSEETTSDEIAPLLDNTNQTLSNVSTSSTNNRAPVRDYRLSTPDRCKRCKLCKQTFGNLTAILTINQHFQNFHPAEFTKIKQLVDQQELKQIFEIKNQPFLMPQADVNTRWNSMYILLEKLQRIRPITDILVNLLALLEPMYYTTIILSSPTLPTQDDLRLIFRGLIIHLNNNENPVINTQHAVANAMK